MKDSLSHTDRLERGKLLVDLFVWRFDPSYRHLARYAAIPLALTIELLNHLHSKFLCTEVPYFEARSDLLLSDDLCREVGREQYVIDSDVRAFLLDDMRKRAEGRRRMQKVAEELLEYVGYMVRNGRALRDLRAQEWAAMVYLDRHRKQAIIEIAETYCQCFLTGEGQDVNRAEVARLSLLVVEELEPQLSETPYYPIVEYARIAGKILAANREEEREFTREGLPEIHIPGVEYPLPSLSRLIRSTEILLRQVSAGTYKPDGDSNIAVANRFALRMLLESLHGSLSEEEINRVINALNVRTPVEVLHLAGEAGIGVGDDQIWIKSEAKIGENAAGESEVSRLLIEASKRASVLIRPEIITLGNLPAGFSEFASRILETARVENETRIIMLQGERKANLALEAMHYLSSEFPDALLRVDMAAGTVDSTMALKKCIYPFIAVGETLPEGIDALSARYQEIFSDRRALILLDRAPDLGSFEPLIPPRGSVLMVAKVVQLDELIDRVKSYISNISKYHREKIESYLIDLAEARQSNSLREEMIALDSLGNALSELGEASIAREFYERALGIAYDMSDKPHQLQLLINLARALSDLGLVDQSLDRFEDALIYAQRIKDRAAEAEAWSGKGDAYAKFGQWERASECYERGMEIARESDDSVAEVRSLKQLASAALGQGDTDRTIRYFEAALEIYHKIGDRRGESEILLAVAGLYFERDKPAFAINRYKTALPILSEIDDRQGEATALNGLGRAYDISGEINNAVEYYERALTAYREIGDRSGEADVLMRLSLTGVNAERDQAVERYEQAIAWAEEALKIYVELNSPEVERLKEQIAKWRLAAATTAGIMISTFEFETVWLNASGSITERRKLQRHQFIEELAPDIAFEMVEIPGRTFKMGSPENEARDFDSEKPQQLVTVSPFFMGKYQVTQKQWRTVASLPKVSRNLESDPSHFKGDDLPVERVSWEEAVEFCKRLSLATGRKYRLPTEAEWEYACRAGTETPFAFGETITPEIVNYNGESPYAMTPSARNRRQTVAVGSLGVANGFGLYDMHGNVWEWCMDWYSENYYRQRTSDAPIDDPIGPSTGSKRVIRGGGWYPDAQNCRSAYRGRSSPGHHTDSLGFRIVRALSG